MSIADYRLTRRSALQRVLDALATGPPDDPFGTDMHILLQVGKHNGVEYVARQYDVTTIASLQWSFVGGTGGPALATSTVAYYDDEMPWVSTAPSPAWSSLDNWVQNALATRFSRHAPAATGAFSALQQGYLVDTTAHRRTLAAPFECRSVCSSRVAARAENQLLPEGPTMPLATLIEWTGADGRVALTSHEGRYVIDDMYPLHIDVVTTDYLAPSPSDVVRMLDAAQVWTRDLARGYEPNPLEQWTGDPWIYVPAHYEFVAPCYRSVVADEQIATAPAIPADLVLSNQPYGGRVDAEALPTIVRTRRSVNEADGWIEHVPTNLDPLVPTRLLDLDWMIDRTPPSMKATGRVIADALEARRTRTDVSPTTISFAVHALLRRYAIDGDRRAAWFAHYVMHLRAGDAVTLAQGVVDSAPERSYICESISHEVTPSGWTAKVNLVPVSWVTGTPSTASPLSIEPWSSRRWLDMPSTWTATAGAWTDQTL